MLRYKPLCGDATLLQQLRHTLAGGMTGSVIIQTEVHLPELRELPQHLQHGDGGCPAAGHIVMLLPLLREKGDVGKQVDRGLEDIERVIAAKIVKAVLGSLPSMLPR